MANPAKDAFKNQKIDKSNESEDKNMANPAKDLNYNEKVDNNKDYDNYWYQNPNNQFGKVNNCLNRFAAAKAY